MPRSITPHSKQSPLLQQLLSSGFKCKAKILVGPHKLHDFFIEHKVWHIAAPSFEDHYLCFAEIDYQSMLFTKACQCVQLLLKTLLRFLTSA